MNNILKLDRKNNSFYIVLVMNNQIIHWEEKLAKMRKEYKVASPAMKNYLLQESKLVKHKLELLKAKENIIPPPKLF